MRINVYPSPCCTCGRLVNPGEGRWQAKPKRVEHLECRKNRLSDKHALSITKRDQARTAALREAMEAIRQLVNPVNPSDRLQLGKQDGIQRALAAVEALLTEPTP